MNFLEVTKPPRQLSLLLMVGALSLCGLSACDRKTILEEAKRVRSVATPGKALDHLRVKARTASPADPMVPAPTRLRRADVLLLFWTGEFATLELILGPLLTEFERSGSRASEETLHAAIDWLSNAPEAHTVATQWIQQHPKSHFARVVLGHALASEAERARGTSFGSETSADRFERMRDWMDRAVPVLSDAIQLSPRPLLSVTGLIRAEQMTGSPLAAAELANIGLRFSPQSKETYVRFLSTLRPQWNGSIEDMQAWVEHARSAAAPEDIVQHLAAQTELAATAQERRANQRSAPDIVGQLAHKYGHSWLWKSYGDALYNAMRPDEALVAYTKAMDAEPHGASDARHWRARVLQGAGKTADAMVDFEASALAGHYQSQEWLIQAYAYGNRGLPRDIAKLRPWCELASTHGNGWGDFCMGGLHFDGLAGLGKNSQIAVQYFEIAARKGHAMAQHDYGWMLINGNNVTANRDAGIGWLRASARQGTEVAKDKLRTLGLNPEVKAETSRWDWLSSRRAFAFAIVPVVLGVLALQLLGRAGRKPAPRQGSLRVMKFSLSAKAMVVVSALLAALAGYGTTLVRPDDQLGAAGLAALFALGTLVLAYQVFFTRLAWDEQNIHYSSPLARNRVIAWSEVRRIGWSFLMQSHFIETNQVRRILCSKLQYGYDEFGDFVLAKLAERVQIKASDESVAAVFADPQRR